MEERLGLLLAVGGVEAAAKFVRRYDARDRLQTHFFAWRFVVVAANGERARHQAADGVDALMLNEAHTHTRVVELEDSQEEMRLVIARLKAERLEYQTERAMIVKSIETHVHRSEHWRNATVAAIDFLGTLNGSLTNVRPLPGSEFGPAMEMASSVVLGWIQSVVHGIPAAAKMRLANFGSDMRDGACYVVLMHCLAPAAISLDCLAQKDPRRRFEVSIDAMTSIGLRPPFGPNDLVTGATDAHFANLFTLWWHFARPPTPDDKTCLAEPGSFRDDVASTAKYLERCRQYYPEWLERRAILLQLLHYVLLCRARDAPVKVTAADEEKAAVRDMAAFGIEPGRKIPGVFLDLAFMTAHHRGLNEEERERINGRVRLHLGLLRPVFSYYAGGGGATDPKSGAPSEPASPSNAAAVAAGAAGAKPKKKADLSETDRMDFIAFYRFCDDCNLVVRSGEGAMATSDGGGDTAAQPQVPTPQPGPRSNARGGAAAAAAAPAAVNPTEPLRLTKPQCYGIFMDTFEKFSVPLAGGGANKMAANGGKAVKSTSRGGMREAHLTPSAWIAACLRIAVMRAQYAEGGGSGATNPTNAPAAAATAFEAFITRSMAPYACCSNALPFQQEVWSPAVQEILQKRRKVLIPFFEYYAGLDGNGTMDFGELTECLEAVESYAGPASTGRGKGGDDAVLRETFAQLTGAVVEDPFAFANASVRPTPAGALLSSDAALPAGGGLGGSTAPAPIETFMVASMESRPTVASGGTSPGPDDASDDGPEADSPAMVYGEFETMLLTLAVHAFPSPHVALAVKAQQFLEPFCNAVALDLKRIAKENGAGTAGSTTAPA